MSSVTQTFRPIPVWDCTAETFKTFKEEMIDCFTERNLSGCVPALNPCELDPPAQGNAKAANGRAIVTFGRAVSSTSLVKIKLRYLKTHPPEDAEGEVLVVYDVNAVFPKTAVALWTAFEEYSTGAVKSTAGISLGAAIISVGRKSAWPEAGTLLQNTSQYLDRLEQVMDLAARLQDAKRPFEDELALDSFLATMPDIYYKMFDSISAVGSIVALRSLVEEAAPRIEALEQRQAAATFTSMVARVTSSASSRAAPDADVLALLGHINGRQPAGANPRQQHRSASSSGRELTRERRLDRAKGPPAHSSGTEPCQWCANHGWCKHLESACNENEPRYRRTADGSFVQIRNNRARGTFNIVDMMSHASLSALRDTIGGRLLLDSGSELNIANSLSALDNVSVLNPINAPVLGGINSVSPVRTTHVGTRKNQYGLNLSAADNITYYAQEIEFNIQAVRPLQLAGIKLVMDSDPVTGPVARLELPDGGCIQLEPVGDRGLWAIPIQVPDADPVFERTAQVLRSDDNIGVRVLATVVEYVEDIDADVDQEEPLDQLRITAIDSDDDDDSDEEVDPKSNEFYDVHSIYSFGPSSVPPGVPVENTLLFGASDGNYYSDGIDYVALSDAARQETQELRDAAVQFDTTVPELLSMKLPDGPTSTQLLAMVNLAAATHTQAHKISLDDVIRTPEGVQSWAEVDISAVRAHLPDRAGDGDFPDQARTPPGSPPPLRVDPLRPVQTSREPHSSLQEAAQRQAELRRDNSWTNTDDNLKYHPEFVATPAVIDEPGTPPGTPPPQRRAAANMPPTQSSTTSPGSPPPRAGRSRHDVPQYRFDYSRFRTQHNIGTHRQTMSYADTLGVKLQNVRDGRDRLDNLHRIANQQAQPLKPMPTPLPNVIRDRTGIVGDTLGSVLPVTAAGNNVCQVWVVIGEDGYYVTVSPDHSAASTCAAFKRFAREAHLNIFTEAISQPFVFFSDNGTEYRGDFDDFLDTAGVEHCTNVVGKSNSGKQYKAEQANKNVQAGMRAQEAHAAPTFAAFKTKSTVPHKPRDYWDWNARHQAEINRTLAMVKAGTCTWPQLARISQAPWGALGTVSISTGSHLRKGKPKQFVARAVLGLYLGNSHGKLAMLTSSGEIITSTDVIFSGIDSRGASTAAAASGDADQADAEDRADNADSTASAPTGDGSATGAAQPQNADAAPTHRAGDAPGGFMPTITNATAQDLAENINNSVAVLWPAMNETYYGTLIDVDSTSTLHDPSGHFEVNYNDGQTCVHPLDGLSEQHVHILAAVRGRARIPWCPHPDVVAYVDGEDIRQQILLGIELLPPQPTLPAITLADKPLMPRSVHAALSADQPLAIYWLYSIVREMVGHNAPVHPHRQPTWRYSQERTIDPPMREQWVFTIKFEHGVLKSFKSRLTADGSIYAGQRGKAYDESFVGTMSINCIRRIDVFAMLCRMFTFDDDLTMAYCQCPTRPRPDGKLKTLGSTPGVRVHDAEGRVKAKILGQGIYGEQSAGWGLYCALGNSLQQIDQPDPNRLCPIPFEQCPFQPTMYKAVFPAGHAHHGDLFFVYVHSDNVRCWTTSVPLYTDIFRPWFAARWEITGKGTPLQQQPPHQLLGTTVSYTATSIAYSMPKYIAAAIERFKIAGTPTKAPLPPGYTVSKLDSPQSVAEERVIVEQVNKKYKQNLPDYKSVQIFYATMLSTFGWIARQVGAIIALAHSVLGRGLARPGTKAFSGMHYAWRFLLGRIDMELLFTADKFYEVKNKDFPVYKMASDASFADCEASRKSQGGWAGWFSGVDTFDSFWSGLSKRVSTSTTMSETIFGCLAAKQATYVYNFHGWLGITDGDPIPLGIDNAATVLTASAPVRKWSPSRKHYDIDCHYIAEAVANNIIFVYHVSGAPPNQETGAVGFPVDCLTKALPITTIVAYYDVVQGCRRHQDVHR